MAYSTSNPPFLIVSQLGGTFKIFGYSSTDAQATVAGSSYITNGQDLGMGLGDLVFVRDTTNTLNHSLTVRTLSTSSQGVTLSAGVDLSS